MSHKLKVSIIIKSLNEEKNIDRAIQSALDAVAPFAGEIIVADSGSIDRTVEKAMKFPVTIVQLAHPDERRCGIGPQLGYQHSCGEYVYILDGDMKLDAEFLTLAIELLAREPLCAGVGGYINEMNSHNLEFEGRIRRKNKQRSKQTVDVATLDGGGLYRRVAVEQIGYLSDRNLHGFEEYDLGVRLRAMGWRLVRIEDHAVDHYGHEMKTLPLLWHRIRTGYVLSAGELVRAAIESHYLKNVLAELRAIRIAIGIWVYWALVILIAFGIPRISWALVFLLLALSLPALTMALRTRSLRYGCYTVLLWHVNAIGFVFGLIRKRITPTERIES